LDARIARLTEPVSLHADHLPRLAAARDQFGQGLAVGVGERAWFGTDPFGDQGDHLGIARIGLGDRPVARAKSLAWVDHGERKAPAPTKPGEVEGCSMTRPCVKRSDAATGFKIVPKRGVVEPSIAWLNRCRRLANDWENLNRKALAFLRLALPFASC
jgi:transposase